MTLQRKRDKVLVVSRIKKELEKLPARTEYVTLSSGELEDVFNEIDFSLIEDFVENGNKLNITIKDFPEEKWWFRILLYLAIYSRQDIIYVFFDEDIFCDYDKPTIKVMDQVKEYFKVDQVCHITLKQLNDYARVSNNLII